MPTKDQLRSIEWALLDARDRPNNCPVCYMHRDSHGVHTSDCWLAAALATPDTLPPVAVGDVIEWKSGRERVFQRIHTEIGAETWNTKLRDKLLGHYRPLWQRGKE